MTRLAKWHLRRLRVLLRGARTYRVTDATNLLLERRGLVARTGQDVGPAHRQYEITEAGQTALREQAVSDQDE